MKLTQISVFLENRKGRLYEVCSLFGKNKVNIRVLTIAETPEFGILRLIVDKPKEAMSILKANDFIAKLTDVVIVESEDEPGGLAGILKILNDNNVNVEYMYGFVEKVMEKALFVFRFDDPDRAIEVLKENDITIVNTADI